MDERLNLLNIMSFLAGEKYGKQFSEKIGTGELIVTEQYSATTEIGKIDVEATFTENDLIWVHTRRKGEVANSTYVGSETILLPINLINNPDATGENHAFYEAIRKESDGKYNGTYSVYGVFAPSIDYSTKKVTISSRYSSSYSPNIEGTYTIDIYKFRVPFSLKE